VNDMYPMYPDCPDMPTEVCVHCPIYDHLNEICDWVLTNRLSCDTIDGSFNLEGGTE